MIYLISNSKYITSEILDNFKFSQEDIVVVFNLKFTIIKIIQHLVDKCITMPKLYWIQRETLNETPFMYRGSSSDLVRVKWFSKFFLMGGAQRLKTEALRKSNTINYDKRIKRESARDFELYKTYLQSFDPNREIIHLDFQNNMCPYGLGYELFGIHNYEPYSGFLSLLYLDRLHPKQQKVMIGFSSYQNEKYIRRSRVFSTHRNSLDYHLLFSYCRDKGIEMRYSQLKDSTLIDDTNTENYPILFRTNNYIDITGLKQNNIDKCKNYDILTQNLIDKDC